MEELVKSYPTVIGRKREDLEKFGKKVAGYIGKHIVGTGEDAHLTTKVFFDFLKVHVVLICGKRGTGKSYSNGVILEEFSKLPAEYRNKMSFVVIDPVGIYWSMKFPNEQQKDLLEKWGLKPEGIKNVRVLVPEKQKESYLSAGVPVDGTITLSLKDLSIDEILMAFNLKRTDPIGIGLERSFIELSKEKENFDLKDLIEAVKKENMKEEIKEALISMLTVIDEWGFITKQGLSVKDLLLPGTITIVDVSRMRSEELRNLLVSLIAREIYRLRVLSRKEEEKAKIEGRKPKFSFPVAWLVLEEAHNFAPSEKEVASSEAIRIIARQGREPGVGLIVITQMPNKLDSDILSQTDLVISFRLTSKKDLDALHEVMQTYMREEIEKYINKLPRWHGAAIVLDDNMEKIFTVNIRPRISWHSGGTAGVI